MDELDLLVESTITDFNFNRANREMRIDVTCAWKGKEKKRIVASGIDNFIVDDMRWYNVIDRVKLYVAENSTEENPECALRLFFLMQRREPVGSDLEWPALQEKLSLIRDSKLTLMEIEPVCGASVLVLAESVRLETIAD